MPHPMIDQQIKDYAHEAACGHFLCNSELAVIDQFNLLENCKNCDIPNGVVVWEPFEEMSAGELFDKIENLQDAFEKAMFAARDGGDPDYLANSDQFECVVCKQVFDNDNSIQIQGDLHCTGCAATVFGNRPAAINDLKKQQCPHCKADLCASETVERHYIDKDAPDVMGDFSDAIGFGHYNDGGDFEPDRPADLSGGRYDLMDDSDRCASCNGQL